ncbi:hypothetical protein FRC20_008819 [Serendipita sp. 405]|nr:hypothetical protein FRC20_008819 [Serendipita sp. 405]
MFGSHLALASSAMGDSLEERKLYGGAIIINLPANLIDASDLRQIPDAQEVFLDPNSDINYIFEVLDRVEPTDPEEAAKFHFDSIAQDSSAESYEVQTVYVSEQQGSSADTPAPILLTGTQKVAKFNRTDLDDVFVLLALFRLTGKPHDIVFVLNVPATATTTNINLDVTKQAFSAMANSLKIVDFGLFA